MRSILGLILVFSCTACGPMLPPPTPQDRETGRVLEVEPGSFLEISPAVGVQGLTVRVPSRLFVIQNSRQLLVVDVDREGGLPRELSIPMRELDDGSGQPKYVLVTLPGSELVWLDDHCMKCHPGGLLVHCCPAPPLRVVPGRDRVLPGPGPVEPVPPR